MRRVRSILLPLISMLFFFSTYSYAQLWSGIINPSRATDWSQAGIPGGVPTNRTVQCAAVAAYSGSPSTISNAIAGCPAGQFVSLGAGTFNLSGGITFGGHSNVTLRGQGADSTFLVFSGAGAGFFSSTVAMEALNPPSIGLERNVCDWTAGYSPGTTVITLANCGTTPPAVGSLSNLGVGNILILDQVNEAADTGQIWNCGETPACAGNGTGGFARSNGPSVGGISHRSMQQTVVVKAINGSQITISPAIRMPNWRSGQAPQAWFGNSTVSGMGLENLSLDGTSAGWSVGSGHIVSMLQCYQCWVSGVRTIKAMRSHISMWEVSHSVVQNSYLYANQSSNTVSYGIELAFADDNLVVNNIIQQSTDSSPSCVGGCEGNVLAYNYAIDTVYASPGWFIASFVQHAGGDDLNLWEGNIGTGYISDAVHGTHHFETLFRNRLVGWQSICYGSPCSNSWTNPVALAAGSRYMNAIGNVLGQSTFHTSYVGTGPATYNLGNSSGYSLTGFCQDPSCATHGGKDPQVTTYLMRWGNYDTVTGTVRWCGNSSDTGWSTTCASASEVPTSLAAFSNAVPTKGDTGAGQSAMPPSFYYSSKPAWFGSIAWPPIGPDVTGGNIANVGGYAYMNPAMNCAVNVMKMLADGSGSALSFNASTCYGSGSASAPAPPTGLTVVVH